MTTLEEVRKRNLELRKQIEDKRELDKLKKEQVFLERQNKALIFKQKNPKLVRNAKVISGVGEKAARKFGRGLVQVAKNLAESERKEAIIRARIAKRTKKVKRNPIKRTKKVKKRKR